MATPAWATDLTTFWLEGATTVTAIGTGGAGLGNPETDFFIQGADCISKGAWTNATKGFIVDGLATTFTVPTDGCVVLFAKYDAAGSLDTKANGGLQIIIGSANTAYYHYYVGGKNTLAFDSWIPYAIDPNTATVDNTTGSPSGSERWVGILGTLPTTSGPTKGNPIAIDAVRYGRGRMDYTFGDGTFGYNTFSGMEAYGNDATRRWGLIEFLRGAYLTQGFHRFGILGGNPVDFRDSNKVLFWRAVGDNNLTNDAVSTGFNRVEIQHASSNVQWDNIIWQALGTRARGVFVHSQGACSLTNCQLIGWSTFTFLSTAVATDCTFRSCDTVTAPGSTLTGSKILTSRVATNAGALVWNTATDTDGKINGMAFSKGTNAHHAIDFGTSVTADITLRGIEFTGFGSTPDANDSTVRFLATSGTLTLNLSGCTVNGGAATAGNFSVDDSAGITVTVVIDPVTTLVKILDGRDNSNLQNARVILLASSGAGDLPYEDSVSITQSAGTATVSHTGHGLVTGNKVVIEGATNDPSYNGVKTITFVSVNSYTYSCDTGAPSPATGTITSTGVVLEGLTNASGEISDTRTWGLAQPVTGVARKATSSPIFKDSSLTGSISTANGLSITQALVFDE